MDFWTILRWSKDRISRGMFNLTEEICWIKLGWIGTTIGTPLSFLAGGIRLNVLWLLDVSSDTWINTSMTYEQSSMGFSFSFAVFFLNETTEPKPKSLSPCLILTNRPGCKKGTKIRKKKLNIILNFRALIKQQKK